MSYKKLSLPTFMGADGRSRAQEEMASSSGSRDGAGGLSREEPPVVRAAAFKKLKSSRKKWFVLLGPTSTEPARLEYYDNERKWRARAPPKRSIVLEKCFNINRKQDTRNARNKIVIALYTLDDCVNIVFELENELEDWLDQLLTLQQGKSGNIDGKKPVPNFEHMWTVTVKNFTPEENNFTRVGHLLGPQRLCVTSNSVKFFPVGSDHCAEFPHACIRSCAYNDRHFKLETGRNSPSGSGSLFIDCDDKDVTHHLHETLHKAMSNSNKDLYLKSRIRSQSMSDPRGGVVGSHNTSAGHIGHHPKTIPLPVERNRTISEPPVTPGGQVTPEPGMKPARPHSVRYGSYSTSPSAGANPLSPISPVGSVSTGLLSDGTGSSNSINDPACNGDFHELAIGSGNLNSYQPDVIPEESSGEISIEFNTKPEVINQTLPRAQPPRTYYHQKQASLTDFTYDDYMDMGGQAPPPASSKGPPLPKRNYESSNKETSSPRDQLSQMTSPCGSQQSASSSYNSEYHIMSPSGGGAISLAGSQTTPQISPSEVPVDDQNPYFDMERLNLHCGEPTSTSTPLKSTSSVTLVHPDSIDAPSSLAFQSQLGPAEVNIPILAARTPPVAIKSSLNNPATILTPPEGIGLAAGKHRIPSGDGGYVIMSPGVAPSNPEKVRSVMDEKSGLNSMLESTGVGAPEWRGSPRHASPSSTARIPRDKSWGGTKRNSSCLDESEAHWEAWRYDCEPLDTSTDDIYHSIYYPASVQKLRNPANPNTTVPSVSSIQL